MSTHHLSYPPDFEINHAAAHHEERRRRALQRLDVGDVLSIIDSLIAQEPDPRQHPCYPMVQFLLDREWSPGDGGTFFDAWKMLACQAIDRCVDDALALED